MPNSEAGTRRSGGQLSIVLAAVAVVLIVGLLVWLNATSEPSEMMAIREAREADDTPPASPDGAPVPVTLQDFSANVATYVGQNIRLDNVPVAARMGTQAFWINLTGDVPFLVRISPELVQEGRTVDAGQRVTVEGVVQERTAEVLATWEAEGVITSPGQRAEAEFADRFLHARRVIPGGGAAPAGQE
jgi:hypothetical protein